MSSNITSDKSEINNSNDKISLFWNKGIWDIDIKIINNINLLNIFMQIRKYESQLNDNKSVLKFNINQNNDFEIINEYKIIKKKIIKIKKENLNYLKKHADCFYEYHLIIYDVLKKKKLSWDYPILNEKKIL